MEPSPSSRTPPAEWSDQKCIEIASENFFPTVAKNIATQKNIIEKFLNFYLGAKSGTKSGALTPCSLQGVSVPDLVFSAISIMPLHEATEQCIWDDDHFTEDGTLFFLTPEDKLRADIKVALGKTKPENEPSEAEESVNNEALARDNVNNANGNEERSGNLKDTKQNVAESHILNKERTSMQFNIQTEAANAHNITNDNSKIPQEHVYERPKQNFIKCNVTFPDTIIWFSDKGKRAVQEPVHLQYGPVENAAFVAGCKRLLDAWDTDPLARMFLKYLFGIIALTLMRAATKSYKHLVNTFSSNKFLNNLPMRGDFKYSIPHKRCVKRAYRTFSKRNCDFRVMFAKIVINSCRLDGLRKKYGLKCNIFKVAVLAHTADYGLGLLSMVQTIKQQLFNTSFNDVVKVTWCDDTVESWQRLKAFVDRYMVVTSKQCTHYWARVIDKSFFGDLCCSSNYPLAVILATFIEKLCDNPGIWESTWVSRGENLELFKERGYKMVNELRK